MWLYWARHLSGGYDGRVAEVLGVSNMSFRHWPRWSPLIWRHGPFIVLLAAAAAVRILAWLAIHPAMWVLLDGVGYVLQAMDPRPGNFRPSGYALLMLRPLLPAHSLSLVTALQHAMSLGVGVLTYAALIRLGLPRWVSVLAALPLLFDGYLISLEQMVGSDLLFGTLVAVGLLLLVWRAGRPPHLVVAAAGLALGLAAITRVAGTPLPAAALLFLLLPRPAWSRLAVLGVAVAVPVVLYGVWFSQFYGGFNLTATSGIYLYAHTTVFVDCRRVHFSDQGLYRLCPTGTHKEDWYIFAPDSPINDAGLPWLEADRRARTFALEAIEQQPADFVRLAWSDLVTSFGWDQSGVLPGVGFVPQALPASAHTAGIAYQRRDPGPLVRPRLLDFMQRYEAIVSVPPPAYLLVLVVGMVGLVFGRDPKRRHLHRSLLLFLGTAALLLVVPAVTTLPDSRYRVPAVAELGPILAISGWLVAQRWLSQREDASDSSPSDEPGHAP